MSSRICGANQAGQWVDGGYRHRYRRDGKFSRNSSIRRWLTTFPVQFRSWLQKKSTISVKTSFFLEGTTPQAHNTPQGYRLCPSNYMTVVIVRRAHIFFGSYMVVNPIVLSAHLTTQNQQQTLPIENWFKQ